MREDACDKLVVEADALEDRSPLQNPCCLSGPAPSDFLPHAGLSTVFVLLRTFF
jgi:hypothetical protein